MRPSIQPRLPTAAAMNSGAISQALGERVRDSSAATIPAPASSPSTGSHGTTGTASSGFCAPLPTKEITRNGAKTTISADPRRLRDHDRLELPAVLRGDVHGLDHAARNGGEERRGAVDAAEPHVDEPADGADDGREEGGGDDQRQQRDELGDHRRGELQAGRGADHQRSRRPAPGDQPHRRARERQRHDGGERAEQPRQRQMDVARAA